MWNIIGHERAIQMLQQAMSAKHLQQSLLFTGPAGIGKARLAVELAKALNCTGTDPPCQMCIHCRQIQAGSHPDVTIVESPDGKDSIPISSIRELRNAASLTPFQGRQRVCIVAGAELLTAQAADALLKTLEEPQPQVTIVLTAIEAEMLPSTIVSRCRVVTLAPVEQRRIEEGLRAQGLADMNARCLARLSQGNVGWAFQAAKQPQLLEQREEMITLLVRLLDVDLDARLRLVEQLTTERKDRSVVRRTLELLVAVVRDLLLVSQGCSAELVPDACKDDVARQAQRYSLAQIHNYLRRVRLTIRRVDQNVDPRLALEALVVHLPCE